MNSLSIHQVRAVSVSDIRCIDGTYSRHIVFKHDTRYFPKDVKQQVSFEITLFSDNKKDLEVHFK